VNQTSSKNDSCCCGVISAGEGTLLFVRGSADQTLDIDWCPQCMILPYLFDHSLYSTPILLKTWIAQRWNSIKVWGRLISLILDASNPMAIIKKFREAGIGLWPPQCSMKANQKKEESLFFTFLREDHKVDHFWRRQTTIISSTFMTWNAKVNWSEPTRTGSFIAVFW
jgi:hypothetical protein